MIPLRAQLEEVNREIAIRERVYPRWIDEKRITADRAKRKLETLQAVAETLRGIIAKEEALGL